MVVQQIEQLLKQMVMPELEFIRHTLTGRVERCEFDLREHSSQIRELYSLSAAGKAYVEDLQARLDKLEKK